MQKRGIFVVLVLSFLFISLSFASAFSLSDFFKEFYGKITGRAIDSSAIPSGLIGYWNADGNALDGSGNGNNGVWYGAENYGVGKFGQAFNFDGSTNYINIGRQTTIEGVSPVYSVVLWVRMSSTTNRILFSYDHNNVAGDQGNGYDEYVYWKNSQLAWQVGSGGAVRGGESNTNIADLADGNWHHLAFVMNGGTAQTYEDGSFKTSITTSGLTGGSSYILRFGNGENVGYWKGSMDEIMIFNKALSASEVQQLYNPITTQIICTEFTYSSWGNCSSSGTQTRTIVTSSPSGCSGGNPILSQNCNYVPPTATCSDGILNGNEMGIDCGGLCSPCAALSSCNSDSDCAMESANIFCEGNNACLGFISSSCINAGTDSSYCNFSQRKQCSPCADGCLNGECIGGNSNCTDSESAVSYYVAGNVNYNGQNYPDDCSGDLLVEYSCVSGSLFTYPAYNCSLEGKSCQNGVCVGTNTGTKGIGFSDSCNEGCDYDGKCIPVGYRFIVNGTPSYCDIYGIDSQKVNTENLTMSCQNSYECSSNICSSGECVELEGFKAGFVKILCRITNLFNSQGYEKCLAEYIYGANVTLGNETNITIAGNVTNQTNVTLGNETNVTLGNITNITIGNETNITLGNGTDLTSANLTEVNCTDEQILKSLFGNDSFVDNETVCDSQQVLDFIFNSNLTLDNGSTAINYNITFNLTSIYDALDNFLNSNFTLSNGSCYDSDEGLNFYTLGQVRGLLENAKPVPEKAAIDCPLLEPPPEGYCSNGTWVPRGPGLDENGCPQYPKCVDAICPVLKSLVAPSCENGTLEYTYDSIGCLSGYKCEPYTIYAENVSDFCFSLNPLVDAGEYLIESYCKDTDYLDKTVEDCEYGCFNGACFSDFPECVENIAKSKYEKGYSSGLSGRTYLYNQPDYCVDNLDNKTAGLSGNYVAKHGCVHNDELNETGQLSYTLYDCENGCYDGACIPQRAQCNGLSGNYSGYLYGDLGSFMKASDTCYHENNYTSFVQKFYCETNGVLNFSLDYCEFGCSGGRCLNRSEFYNLSGINGSQKEVGSYCLNVNITEPAPKQDQGQICMDALGTGCNDKTLLFAENDSSKICYTDLCPTRNALDELRCNYRISGANASKVYNLWNTDYGDSYGNWVTARVNCSSNLCKSGPCDKLSGKDVPVVNVTVIECAEGSDVCEKGNYLSKYYLNFSDGNITSRMYKCDYCIRGNGTNCIESDYSQDYTNYMENKCGDGVVQSWEECDNGTGNVQAPSRVASCVGSPSCSNYNSDESTCNNALGGSVCSFSAGSGSYCGPSGGPYGVPSSSYCRQYDSNQYDCDYNAGGNCAYNYMTYNCDLAYTDCRHWDGDPTSCGTMGCNWHEGVANSCLSSSERGCPWYKALFGFCPEAPSCSLKGDKTGCVNSYGGECVFSKGSSVVSSTNSDCEVGTCGDGTTYEKYVSNNGLCSPVCYMSDPCEGHEGIGIFSLNSGKLGGLLPNIKIQTDTKENCTYIPLSDGKLLISRELSCNNSDCVNGNGKTCKPVQNESSYVFPGTTSHMNCADLGVSGVVERNGGIMRGPFAGKLKCNTECKIDTSDCRRITINAGEICLLSEIVEFNQSVSSVDSKCDDNKGDVPCGEVIGRGCSSGQICKISSSGSSSCVPADSNTLIGGKVGGCPAFCGDGILDAGEECDRTDLNNKTCEGFGPYYGQLNCDSSCKFDRSKCTLDPLPPGQGCTYESYPMQVCTNGGGCVDLSSDFWNCGGCNNICGENQVCKNGQCTCPG